MHDMAPKREQMEPPKNPFDKDAEKTREASEAEKARREKHLKAVADAEVYWKKKGR